MQELSRTSVRDLVQRLIALLISIAIILTTLQLQPLTAYAIDAGQIIAKIVADITGSDGSGGNSTIQGGIRYNRTGYLCYLLKADGGTIPGMQAKLFKCKGFNSLGGFIHCTSKRGGYVVTSFNGGDAPWDYTPFNEDKTTNQHLIKQWMETPNEAGEYQAVQFVRTHWGDDVKEKFKNGEYVLVVETVLHFQFSKKGGGLSKAEIESKYYITEAALKEKLKGMGYDISGMPPGVITYITNSINQEIYKKMSKSGYEKVGSPIVGTCTDCLDYYHSLQSSIGLSINLFASYTNQIAPFAEMINVGGPGQRAGFEPWTGSRSSKISDADVKKYGVAMFVFKMKDDAINTYWEPNGSPGDPEPAEPNKKGTCNIVKGYYKENITTGVKESLGVHYRLDCTNNIIISGEENFELVEWRITDTLNTGVNPIAWNPSGTTTQTGKMATQVSLKVPEKCVYVLLRQTEEEEIEKQDYNYLIPQSLISRRIWFSSPDIQGSMTKIQDHEFEWAIPAHKIECDERHKYYTDCPGHPGSHNSSCDLSQCTENHTHTDACDTSVCTSSHTWTHSYKCVENKEKCTVWEWKERKLKLSIYNSLKTDDTYKTIVATKDGFKGIETTTGGLAKHYYKNLGSFDRESTDAVDYEESGWDYVMVILRGQDKLRLAQWINNGEGKKAATTANTDLASLSSAGVFENSNTPAGTRKKQEYYDAFSAKFVQSDSSDGADIETTYHPTVKAPVTQELCPDDTQYTTLNPLEINNIAVKVEVYSGNPAGGHADASVNDSDMMTLPLSGYNHSSGRMTQSGGTISFYPYIQMRYDTLASTNNTAYVMGEHQRQMITNDYAEISWNEKGSPNLSLISSQWSIHASAKADYGNNNVLPGGAQLGLGIKTADRQKIMLTTYQCIVKDKGKTQVDNTGGSDGGLTEDQAIAAHQAYVSSVVAALDNTNVQQFVEKNPGASDAFSGIKVNPGVDISSLGTGAGNASTDDKYYFRDDGAGYGANEGDLDVKQEDKGKTYYEFRSDTNGDILMNDTPILTKTQDASALTNATAKMLDDRTYVVRKLVAAVERNTGHDVGVGSAVSAPSWAPDGAFYNETFDGVYVLVQKTELTVGYIDPAERTQILDPKLQAKSNKKGDFFTAYFLSQFKTRDYSNSYGTQYQVGAFKGKDVKMNEMDYLFYSRKFWIPNVNTQDLH